MVPEPIIIDLNTTKTTHGLVFPLLLPFNRCRCSIKTKIAEPLGTDKDQNGTAIEEDLGHLLVLGRLLVLILLGIHLVQGMMLELSLTPLHATRVVLVILFLEDLVLMLPHPKLGLVIDVGEVELLINLELTHILDRIPSRLLMLLVVVHHLRHNHLLQIRPPLL